MPHRPKLTSIVPNLTDRTVVSLAACEVCGNVQVFNDIENARFPETGYWIECRACRDWTMFYLLELLARVINKNHSYNHDVRAYGQSAIPKRQS